MKYFTSEWWLKGCEDDTVSDRYQKYYSSISAQLPVDILTLDKKHTLHDSNIESIETDLTKNEITITLIGWDQEFNNQIKYELSFSQVEKFNQTLPVEENGYGDLGYWEYEIVEDSVEMRMLFATSAEIRIVFNGFKFNYQVCKA